MKLKKLSAMVIAAAMSVAMAGCGGGAAQKGSSAPDTTDPTTTEESSSDVGSLTIGFSNCSQDTPFFANMTPIIQEYAEGLGVKVVALNADNDIAKQNQDIQDLVSQGIDILIMNPVNEDGPSAGIEACNNADIPVVTVDKNVKGGYTAWVGRDNQEMGRLCGQRLVELLGGEDATGTILEIQGTAGSTTMMQRRDGFHEAVDDIPGITVVQSSYCDYDRSKAIPATQDLVQGNSDIVAIFGHNDDMALGAAQVCAEKGLDDVLVCGVDGLMEAVLQIQEGKYAVTTSNDPVLLGQTAVDVAIQIHNNEKVDDFIDAGTVVIDAENVDEYADPDLDFATMVK